MAERVRPRGTVQKWVDQGTQYQLFPEEYFSAADVTLHFGDTWVDDVQAIEFTLAERVLPIYGYGSRSFDSIARGTRIVQGQFAIAFREAGYLYSILDRLGADPYLKPQLAHLMNAESDNTFTGQAKQRIEDILALRAPDAPKRDKGTDPWNLSAMDTPTLRRGDADRVQFFDWSKTVTNCGELVAGVGRVEARGEFSKAEADELRSEATQAADYLKTRRYDDAIRPLGRFWMKVDSIAGLDRVPKLQPASEQWLKDLAQETANLIRKGALEVDGPIKLTKKQLSERGYYAGPIDGSFDDTLARAVAKFQEKMDILPANGELTKETRIALFYAKFENTQAIARLSSARQQQTASVSGAKYRWAKYEAEIWGRGEEVKRNDSSVRNDFARRFEPFFYRGDNQADLRQRGFDIFMTFGPLADDAQINGGLDDRVGFNTTVKAIRNVQITGVTLQTTVHAQGTAIVEVYSFIAEDID